MYGSIAFSFRIVDSAFLRASLRTSSYYAGTLLMVYRNSKSPGERYLDAYSIYIAYRFRYGRVTNSLSVVG